MTDDQLEMYHYYMSATIDHVASAMAKMAKAALYGPEPGETYDFLEGAETDIRRALNLVEKARLGRGETSPDGPGTK